MGCEMRHLHEEGKSPLVRDVDACVNAERCALVIEAEREALPEGDKIGQHLLVLQVWRRCEQSVQMTSAEEVKKGHVTPSVLDQDRQGLQELHPDLQGRRGCTQCAQEKLQPLALAEEVEKRAFVALTPDQCLGDLPDHFRSACCLGGGNLGRRAACPCDSRRRQARCDAPQQLVEVLRGIPHKLCGLHGAERPTIVVDQGAERGFEHEAKFLRPRLEGGGGQRASKTRGHRATWSKKTYGAT
mmetsp:Transcript_55462/g.154579  ORF Transcript_55462/g.154579 Transcript_55462/m.154579 type:complete len:243 (+) Transcript_55462:968-1696(+)